MQILFRTYADSDEIPLIFWSHPKHILLDPMQILMRSHWYSDHILSIFLLDPMHILIRSYADSDLILGRFWSNPTRFCSEPMQILMRSYWYSDQILCRVWSDPRQILVRSLADQFSSDRSLLSRFQILFFTPF